MYNTNALNDTTRPKSWADLTKARYKNKLTLANPRVSGTRRGGGQRGGAKLRLAVFGKDRRVEAADRRSSSTTCGRR
jgi:ABC-type Fe3+ transport system substrate-binding protein